MAWRVELDSAAVRDLDRLDPPAARRILAFLHGRVVALDDPRSIGEMLKGCGLGEFWKYQVGDYRVIARLEDEALRILVVRLGNQREMYRWRLSTDGFGSDCHPIHKGNSTRSDSVVQGLCLSRMRF